MILFTRSLDDTSRARLHKASINFAEIDFIKQTPILTEGVFNEIKNGLTEHLVFTSQNAIKIFFQIIENQGFKLNKNTKFYTLSGTSKILLEQHGYSPQLTADSGSALAKVMLENGIKENITFVCGNLRMPYLPDFLNKNGVKVKELVVYNTELAPLSCEDVFNSFVFFSPSGVDAFLIKNKIPDNTLIFAMGKTTTRHIVDKTGLMHVIYPQKPVLSELIDLIITKSSK